MIANQLRTKRRGQAGKSWSVDETYLKVNGKWCYLYRAIDRDGNLVDSRLSEKRDMEAAKQFFKQAIAVVGHTPDQVTTDGHASYPRAVRETAGNSVQHRTSEYLNNRLEQDHRGIKQRYSPMRGFGAFAPAARFCRAFDELRQYFRSSVNDLPLYKNCWVLVHRSIDCFPETRMSFADPGVLSSDRTISPDGNCLGVGKCIAERSRVSRRSATQREHLDAPAAVALLRRQEALQAEAYQLIVHLDLFAMLSHAGKPEHIGSSVSGLMVWRNLDFNVLCSHRSLRDVFETMQPLLTNPQVTKLHYSNESEGHTPAELLGDERYYFVTYYETEAGYEWKIDISFWLSEKPRAQLAHLEYLSERLTEETRLAILWIKDIWQHLPSYPYRVGGTDIYDAVLEHDVRTPAQFKVYLFESGMPIQG